MDLQEIDIFIDDNGEVKLEIRGVKGQKCLDLTQDLEAILGGEILSREMTPEAGEMVQEIKNQEFNWS
ncbi:DUF2997 domain-containing protein [Geminocystis herdmanii]|uniref:DUF2997 domain-containing protein n=1 Tax=Geminocystis herdmanii TaxID=669359 RepID=UPI0003451299|nr:DUF2997 domain-containing protein [Geminocystis herdmanii]